MIRKVKLQEIAEIQFGFYAKPKEKGNAAYLQAKQFDELGNLYYTIDNFLKIDQKNEANVLNDGDVLLVSKGLRNFAWTYSKAIGPAIASSIFFVIKPNRAIVLPDFLTTLFNMQQTQSYFQTLSAGSSIHSIRKSELSEFSFTLPPLSMQEKIVSIKQLHYKDIELSNKILTEKQKVYQAVINTLINKSHE